MKTLPILLIAALLLPTINAASQAQQQARHQIPEVAAAVYIKNSYAKNLRVAIDNKRYFSLSEERPADQRLPQSLSGSVWESVGTRAVDKNAIQTCTTRYACKFNDVDALISVGHPIGAGSKIDLLVRLEVEVEPGRPKGRDISVYRVELARIGSTWEARGAVVEWRGH